MLAAASSSTWQAPSEHTQQGWHNLPEDEWLRLQVLHVPQKRLKEQGDDAKAWLQFSEAKLCAKARVVREAPTALEAELKEDDLTHQAIYEMAPARISAILSDPEHYMNGKMDKAHNAPLPKGTPKGNMFGSFIAKVFDVRYASSSKQDSVCPGTITKTLMQLMREMVDDTAAQPDNQAGHRWFLKDSSFGCSRRWAKIPRRSGKSVLENLRDTACHCGKVLESELNPRTRIHPSHELWQRGEWLECQKCRKTSAE